MNVLEEALALVEAINWFFENGDASLHRHAYIYPDTHVDLPLGEAVRVLQPRLERLVAAMKGVKS